MKFRNRTVFFVVVIIAVLVLAGGVIYAERPALKLRTSVDAAPFTGHVPDVLPPVIRGDMKVTKNAGKATSLLQFDDGTCESGLGGGTWSSVVDWDVPTQCIQAGLDIVGLSAKINSNTAWSFVMYQAGAAPTAGRVAIAIAPMTGTGPCPTNQTIQTRAIGPAAAVVTGTANFYAGVYGSCFPGRDTGISAGRMWVATTGGGGYSPTYLAGAGFGGNWVIRVTVEDQNCVPVELQSFSVK
ncbi:MAG: hypothetical protein K8R59_17315 [Thermoanaerobaculales bacterium]|nr:hypothetical protein [Thermoanaerobaculales bacterium]